MFGAAVDLLARTTGLRDLAEAAHQRLLTRADQAEGFFLSRHPPDKSASSEVSSGYAFKPPSSSTLDGRRWIKSVWKGFEVTNPSRIIVLLHFRSAGRSFSRLVWFGSLDQPHTHTRGVGLPSSFRLNDSE